MDNHERQLEDGIFIGNQVDKGNLKNPISRALVNGFDKRLFEGLTRLAPRSIHEVGCGEARLTRAMQETFQVPVHGSDFSAAVIDGNAQWAKDALSFEQLSIYDLDAQRHGRDVVVCCEVLEHLEAPERGLAKLRELGARAYLLSVPREPIWRALNMARGQYWGDWGNTPGHLNHWSPSAFARFLEGGGFEVDAWYNPFPWIMVSARIRE
ncbi:class I SAM-dependent methyltransferase [Pelagicoccus sp. SDUM812002]|uniref:class I SAM-dependent methyltransferase n=1 Tax=Pelagicoccus sp. SDUM812002 TaxID=3041266 RepID=UPI00280E9158|nr:class I SAM-dependent methyltransferase [Pelagicoccus sp. SDUM812002]MDQ8186384.1 class I SAM-dependent methyltransferase [Pelagicoccus sp. SDUM812002]